MLGFGGIFGIGNDHYPVPWNNLEYDVQLGGYQLDVTPDHLKAAPNYGSDAEFDWLGRSKDIDSYW